nr:MAG TPA: hypothetical protein [Caudoviricetes sp.]
MKFTPETEKSKYFPLISFISANICAPPYMKES